MSTVRRIVLIASTVLAAGLVAGVGAYLLQAQASSASRLRHDLQRRASLTAGMIGAALGASSSTDAQYARQLFGGPDATLQAAVAADAKSQHNWRELVVGGDGELLAAYPSGSRTEHRRWAASSEVPHARAGRFWVSDPVLSPAGPQLMLAVPFSTAHGLRVWSSSTPAAAVISVAQSYLAIALGAQSGNGFLIDGHSLAIGSNHQTAIGSPLPDKQLARALRHSSSGNAGNDFYTAAAVPSTNWRVLLAVPRNVLLGPMQATRRLAWILFCSLVLAIVCLVFVWASALRRSARVAHERLHDTLIGLPYRTLFLQRTNMALDDARRDGGQVATLFIDLDRFKPVNDIHGHATGDKLLSAVTERLRGAVRAADYLSRFGGDEFLVLCPNITDQQQALQVAGRIQRAIQQPFHIDEHQITIGCSIGVAMHALHGDPTDAQTLIHNADLAMYDAKNGGRGRIELFTCETPLPAPTAV